MKKIISSGFLFVFILFSCKNSSNDQKEQDALETPVTSVVGIGKVLPKGGIVELSVTRGNKVSKLYKHLGDTVEVGDILFEMEAVNEKLQVQQSNAALKTAEQNIQSLNYDIEAAEVKLSALKREFELSKRLLQVKAETSQKVFQDSIAYVEQMAFVKRQKQNYLAQKASLTEKRIALQTNQVAAEDLSFRALQKGVLIRFDVTVGSVLNPNVSFGELAPSIELVVEGELDELYANRLRKGQKVDLVLVGQTDVLAKGIVDFVGASLQNKSIIYETVGEASDRRVRRFTVRITQGHEQLLINQKVECKIHL